MHNKEEATFVSTDMYQRETSPTRRRKREKKRKKRQRSKKRDAGRLMLPEPRNMGPFIVIPIKSTSSLSANSINAQYPQKNLSVMELVHPPRKSRADKDPYQIAAEKQYSTRRKMRTREKHRKRKKFYYKNDFDKKPSPDVVEVAVPVDPSSSRVAPSSSRAVPSSSRAVPSSSRAVPMSVKSTVDKNLEVSPDVWPWDDFFKAKPGFDFAGWKLFENHYAESWEGILMTIIQLLVVLSLFLMPSGKESLMIHCVSWAHAITYAFVYLYSASVFALKHRKAVLPLTREVQNMISELEVEFFLPEGGPKGLEKKSRILLTNGHY